MALEDIDHAMQLHRSGKFTEAETVCRRILDGSPDNANVLHLLGIVLKDQDRLDDAIAAFQQAVRLEPRNPQYRTNLGNAMKSQNRLNEAVNEFREAATLAPEVPLVHYNLGAGFAGQGKPQEAIAEYRRALSLQPDYAAAWHNLGHALMGIGDRDNAMKALAHGVRLQPNDGELHWNYAWNLLLLGDYTNGLREFEWRWKSSTYRGLKKRFESLHWNGQDISGRRILVYSEGGMGDTIQFARYLPLIAARGGTVILECQPALAPLLRNLAGVGQVLSAGQTMPRFDLSCPMMSLPINFQTTLQTIPAEVPYLHADPQRVSFWAEKFSGSAGGPCIGLVWSGNPDNKNDLKRSIPLPKFAALASKSSVQFFSLQLGPGAQQAKSPGLGFELIDYTGDLRDFGDTAAIMMHLDLVISVDTSVAHLAGALGKKVWTLIPTGPDWRWLLDREDSPWYPTMRLFRQGTPGDWGSVIERVGDELARLFP